MSGDIFFLLMLVLPFLLVLVETHTARSESHNVQEAADDGQSLKEVVFEKVVQRLVRFDHPERIGYDVDDAEEEDKSESAQFGLVAHGDEENERGAEKVDH